MFARTCYRTEKTKATEVSNNTDLFPLQFGRYGGGLSRTPIQEEREDKTTPTTPEGESGPQSGPEKDRASGSTPTPGPESQQHAVVQRSRWQAMLLEAGGLGAAVSEESMRRLQYCLQWLQVSDLLTILN